VLNRKSSKKVHHPHNRSSGSSFSRINSSASLNPHNKSHSHSTFTEELNSGGVEVKDMKGKDKQFEPLMLSQGTQKVQFLLGKSGRSDAVQVGDINKVQRNSVAVDK